MTKPTLVIAVDSDGELLTVANTNVKGPKELVDRVKKAVTLEQKVQFTKPYGENVTASLNIEKPLEVLAALWAANPGRSSLLEAPEEVVEWLLDDELNNGEGDK